MIKYFFLTLASLTLLVAVPQPAQALDCGNNGNFEKVGELCVVKNQLGGQGIASSKKIQDIVPSIIKTLLVITGSIAVLFIIIGGFQYLTSGANPDGVKKGKATLINAIIGLVVIILSYVIVVTVSNLLLKPPV